MNLILLTENDFKQTNIVELRDRRAKHVAYIHRASIGDELRVGLINGKTGRGIVTRLSSDSIELSVSLEDAPPAPLPMKLFLALPRPKFLSRILQSVASLGIKDIYLFNSYRVEKVYWSCTQLHEDSVRENLVLGLEQARDTVLPNVHLRRLFRPFVEDELPSLIQGENALVAHPMAKTECPRGVSRPVSLAVGPEGGFIEYEIEKLSEAGFSPVTLSQRILKVETAITFLIGRLM